MKRRNFIGLSSTLGLMAGVLPGVAIGETKQVEQKSSPCCSKGSCGSFYGTNPRGLGPFN